MNIDLTDLKQNNSGTKYESGYRIVYYYENGYKIGEYCKTIDGFMIGFAESNPIIDNDDIPEFISTTDLLNRYLNEIKDAIGVAIYNINGDCVDKLFREKKKISQNKNR